LFFLKTKKTKG
jgi:uncharacterized Zn-binding protein involved in type VI secretion